MNIVAVPARGAGYAAEVTVEAVETEQTVPRDKSAKKKIFSIN